MKNTNEPIADSKFIFGKSNYILMLAGIFIIIVGFLLMMGYGANTRPDGTFDPNYWNEEIFSFRRIRLAPTVVIIGFAVEIFAILYTKKNND